MTQTALTKATDRPTKTAMKRLMLLAVLAPLGITTACVTVTAPDKPIVINLNISVTQEVVYRLDGQAKSLIQAQPGIF
ncbi:YnbE family lipoprotein [Sphingomonas sp.]|uniref:YnbE family lipoprotein n=1 Tax=Sphingomonas sp. TaxID=28214 RepID=UPI00333FAA5C